MYKEGRHFECSREDGEKCDHYDEGRCTMDEALFVGGRGLAHGHAKNWAVIEGYLPPKGRGRGRRKSVRNKTSIYDY